MVMLERLFYKVLSYGNVGKVILQSWKGYSTKYCLMVMLERLFYKVLSYGNVGKVILQSTVLW